ncbi:hypothetical protein [Bdellovibrio sp. HCB288]|uniref:hypothetical protein n=1 Tax=Bdellovibrio sp. HCB288 TaxID=3394355 RepID=UPI0039B5791E
MMRFSITLIMLFSINSHATPKMGRESGGGTEVSAGFVYIGRTALLLLNSDGIISRQQIDETIKETSVFDVDRICSQDPNTGAINCLDARYQAELKKIEFDRKKWRPKSCEAKFALAAHEYLRAAGLEDSNYQISNSFLGGGPNGKYSREMTAVCNDFGISTPMNNPDSSSSALLPPGYEIVKFDEIPVGSTITINRDLFVVPNQGWAAFETVKKRPGYELDTVRTMCMLRLKSAQPQGLKLKAPIVLKTISNSNPSSLVDVESNKAAIKTIHCTIKYERDGKTVLSDIPFLETVARLLKTVNGSIHLPELPEQ